MFNYQTFPSFQSYLNAFNLLIFAASQTAITSQTSSKILKLRGGVKLYSDEQARGVLCKLLERNQASVQKKNWKVEETNLLCYVVEKQQTAHGINNENLGQLDWQKISQYVPHRDPSACRFRYLSLTSSNISQQPWCESESQILFRLVEPLQQQSINWKRISEKLYDSGVQKIYRTGKQCREHFSCFLRPNLKKGQWTSDQDYMMICLFLKQGKKWSKMTKFIEGRNENSIKNRFFLIFENKVKAKLSHCDLVKMARRKKQKLQKTIKSTIADDVNIENLSIVEMPTQSAGEQPESLLQQRSQPQNQQAVFNVPEQIQKEEELKNEPEQKGELDFTEDFQKYIDL